MATHTIILQCLSRSRPGTSGPKSHLKNTLEARRIGKNWSSGVIESWGKAQHSSTPILLNNVAERRRLNPDPFQLSEVGFAVFSKQVRRLRKKLHMQGAQAGQGPRRTFCTLSPCAAKCNAADGAFCEAVKLDRNFPCLYAISCHACLPKIYPQFAFLCPRLGLLPRGATCRNR